MNTGSGLDILVKSGDFSLLDHNGGNLWYVCFGIAGKNCNWIRKVIKMNKKSDQKKTITVDNFTKLDNQETFCKISKQNRRWQKVTKKNLGPALRQAGNEWGGCSTKYWNPNVSNMFKLSIKFTGSILLVLLYIGGTADHHYFNFLFV